jgi:hypothetical protein
MLATAFVISTAATPVRPLAAPAADEKTALTGCLIRGEGDGAGYFLINTSFAPSYESSAPSTVAPGATGTSGNFSNTFYWLDGDNDLREHVGHRVHIEGYAKGDVEDGDLEIARRDDWTEMTVKSDGRTMKARVPNSSIVESGRDSREVNVLVKRIDVDGIKMIAASCN